MRKISYSLVVFLLCACGSGKDATEQAIQESVDSIQVETPEISEDVIADIIQQIPSPLEISVLLKESGSAYDKSILN